MVDQGRGKEVSKGTQVCEVLTHAPSLTIAHAYLRCSCTTIRPRAPLFPRRKPKADLMVVAVAPPIVPKKRQSSS